MSDKIFDIKNDRRLSQYLYRAGFGLWLMYILMGSSLLQQYAIYRNSVAILCAFTMMIGLFASLIFDYHHDYPEFERRSKWLIFSLAFIALLIYLVVLR
jgi:hypothetical protein